MISKLDNLDESYIVSPIGCYFYGDEFYKKLEAQPFHEGYKFDDGTTIVEGQTYWYKCEAISWNRLAYNSDYDYDDYYNELPPLQYSERQKLLQQQMKCLMK